MAKSRSDVIALESYRPRSQLLAEGSAASRDQQLHWKLGSWLLSWNVLATAMREVQEGFEFEHFGMRKDTVSKDGSAKFCILLFSCMFCMFLCVLLTTYVLSIHPL